ncbi:GNAT family N-acetyltransferase [Desulfarculales bacterium]
MHPAIVLACLLQDLDWFEHLNAHGRQPGRSPCSPPAGGPCQADASHLMLVAEEPGERMMGYGSAQWLPYLFKAGLEAYIPELFVTAGHHGRGLGEALFAALKQEARRCGYSPLILINNQARESYQRGVYFKQDWQERSNMANFCYSL